MRRFPTSEVEKRTAGYASSKRGNIDKAAGSSTVFAFEPETVKQGGMGFQIGKLGKEGSRRADVSRMTPLKVRIFGTFLNLRELGIFKGPNVAS